MTHVARDGEIVSLELPGLAADAFGMIGLPWPGIDEDQLRGWADDLRGYAVEIVSLSGRSKTAVEALAVRDESISGRALAREWERYHKVISDLRGPLEVFARALDVSADAVVAQKAVVIGAAVALAGELIATQGEALATFGLAEAEVPVEVAAARLVVRAALQELEGQLLGTLISKAAAEISAVLGGAVGRLAAGGGQVAAETVALKADYGAMQTLASALGGHAAQVSQASSMSWRRTAGRQLETGGPGGGWQEVARAVEQAALHVLAQVFERLGRVIWTIIKDTAEFLRKAITAFRHTDTELAAKAAGHWVDGAVSKWTGAGDGNARLVQDGALYSRDAPRSNLDVLMNGGGLPRTASTVQSVASRAGVGLTGISVRIIEDAEYVRYLDYQGACALTPNELMGSEIHLGPASFADAETLAVTLAHERTHVFQLQLYGVASTARVKQFEDAAYAIEPTFLDYFRSGGRDG